jgi:hypothetical protein
MAAVARVERYLTPLSTAYRFALGGVEAVIQQRGWTYF